MNVTRQGGLPWRFTGSAGATCTPGPNPQTAIGRFTVPLQPMLGCFGVAPAGDQAISASTARPHGGNMDYRGFIEGVTAFFPVFVPGALFSLGDGHAAQADGEVLGTGIEVPFDVQFTVRVLKRGSIAWPRAEDGRFIMTLGNARPLDQAVQHAVCRIEKQRLPGGLGWD
jgi:amidase